MINSHIFEKGYIAFIILSKEGHFTILDASSNIERLFGINLQKALDSKTSFIDLVHHKDRDLYIDQSKQIREGDADLFEFDHYRIKTPKGNNTWIKASAYTEFSEELNQEVVISFLEDISSQKIIEKENQGTKKRLELVLEGTRLGMWDWNPQTNQVFFNERWATMLGYDFSEIDHNLKTWESKVHPDDLSKCYQDITAHINGEVDFYENIHRMKRKDGTWAYILDRGKIVERNEKGAPIRFTGTHTDISAQKEAEIKAHEASQAKSMFLAKMSHEIRTPMNGVLGLVSLLKKTSLDFKQKKYVSTIHESGKLLLAILNDILDYSKIEAGKFELEEYNFKLKPTLTNLYNLFSEKALLKKLDYKLFLDEHLPEDVYSDSLRINQVLMNLISNGIKFTDAGSVKLDVRLQQSDNEYHEILFKVSDTGKGIKDKNSIFVEFNQEDNSISRKYGGTGLGLSIARSIIELFGSRLEIDSKQGEGSTFYFILKLKRAIEEKITSLPDLTQPLPTHEILIVEDNEVNQLVLESVLELMGQKTFVVQNGQEALTMLKVRSFDTVITDIHMPVMDGIEMTKRIMKLPSQPVILAITADLMPEIREACHNAGITEFIPKPFTEEDIEKILRKFPPKYVRT